jgi:ribosomal protein L23
MSCLKKPILTEKTTHLLNKQNLENTKYIFTQAKQQIIETEKNA